ncbi:MAG: pilus assembly protein PilZ [Gammaproteobacteria bacterium]|jgi:type IV pilus assembly protein PilZ|nr:pilus assembly protein PilZ [Gammaproteobacteria bacterium]
MTDQPNHFSIFFKDKTELYKQYMPFVQQGGLFVHTLKQFSLGDGVTLAVQLPDDSNKHIIAGRVVWITPQSAQRGLATGIGVQFAPDDAAPLRSKIEDYLTDMLHSHHPTDTL